jgi:hypothetical protein
MLIVISQATNEKIISIKTQQQKNKGFKMAYQRRKERKDSKGS